MKQKSKISVTTYHDFVRDQDPGSVNEVTAYVCLVTKIKDTRQIDRILHALNPDVQIYKGLAYIKDQDLKKITRRICSSTYYQQELIRLLLLEDYGAADPASSSERL
jgi:hypothetical protein